MNVTLVLRVSKLRRMSSISRSGVVQILLRPIFVYSGAEAPIDNQIIGVGFLTENAASFNALVVYIELLEDNQFAYEPD